MAIYIMIKKVSETDSQAEYVFGEDEKHLGKFVIDKLTGEVFVLTDAPGDESDFLLTRAVHKIRKFWKKGENLPDIESWAT